MAVYRRKVAIALLVIVAVGLLIWAFVRTRSEPVDAVTIKWSGSGHSERESDAFRRWDTADPAVIPTNCAKCHSTIGYMDFLGEDGTAAGQVDNASPIGTTVECVACHNESSMRMAGVVFPSQAEISDLQGQGNCMQCHQGRASTVQVDRATQDMEADQVNEKLAFVNVHYRPAAATRWGSEVRGGYQYAGQGYAGLFQHVRDYQQCAECHDPHSLKVNPQQCSPCHVNVVDAGDLQGIRMAGTDWSGEGAPDRGVALEIAALHGRLYEAIQDYAASVAGAPIAYTPRANPYFCVDKNGDGAANGEETAAANRYASWTPRLLRAAYNLHFVQMDPGAYTHNPRYVIQLLHDSLADLGQRVDVDMAGMTRPE